jgi:Protein of unknown function (DUF1573)
MKKLAILITLFISITVCRAQTATLQTAPNGVAVPRPADFLQLKETSHNFGKIPQGRPAVYIFEIANNGPVPLTLDNVQASCGCTTPEWSRDPIPAGTTAKIKVGYNAYADGPFTKTVTIVYNTNQTKTLTISGEVFKAPTGSAPENASVQLLKQIN